jgi:hypothetical protein
MVAVVSGGVGCCYPDKREIPAPENHIVRFDHRGKFDGFKWYFIVLCNRRRMIKLTDVRLPIINAQAYFLA